MLFRSGFIAGIFFTVIFVFFGTTSEAAAPGIPVFLLPFSIIVFPILYGIMGFVMGIICAVVYNFLARKIGGVMVDLKKTGKS